MRLFIILSFLTPNVVSSQPICEAFLYTHDTLQYRACKLVEDIDEKHYQFSRAFQMLYDSAIKICPYFAYAYREKSVAYLKSGDFITWKTLIDKAVLYDTIGNLGYRAWCRYEFFRDYEGAIKDIEFLESRTNEPGYGITGDYHLTITKAICYSELGQIEKAISIMKEHLKNKKRPAGLFDYYQLGACYYKKRDFVNAKKAFLQQIEINNLAEAHYYLSLIYTELDDLPTSVQELNTAKKLREEGRKLRMNYTHHSNSIYF